MPGTKSDKSGIGSWKKHFYYFLISQLPKPIRHSFYRNKFARAPSGIPEGLTFELARTQDELEAAFKLLHDAYVEQGFIGSQSFLAYAD